MNKYVTDYEYCIDLIYKPIELAEAYSVIDKKGKSLIYDPTAGRMALLVTVYSLVQYDLQKEKSVDWYYSAELDLFFEKIVTTQNLVCDLPEAVELYNSIEIKNDTGN